MDKDVIGAIVTVLLAIIGVAILAELVSNQANTGQVLSTGGGAFSQMLCTALSPIMGQGMLTGCQQATVGSGAGSGG